MTLSLSTLGKFHGFQGCEPGIVNIFWLSEKPNIFLINHNIVKSISFTLKNVSILKEQQQNGCGIYFKLRRLMRQEINAIPDLTLGLVRIHDLIRSTAKTGLWAINMLYQCSFLKLTTALWQLQRISFVGTTR